MTVTTSLVVELIGAANGVKRLPAAEPRRLLKIGISASGALRRLLLRTGKVAPLDTSAEHVIEDIAENVEAMSEATVAKALLALADQIRTLRILNREDA